MHFRLYALQLTFIAREAVVFPPGLAANRLRGAFGAVLHKSGAAAIFEPSSENGPSGLADQPRPFVFRTEHLNGAALAPGEKFQFDFHWFDLRRPSLDTAIGAFAELGIAELIDVRGADAPLALCLDPSSNGANRIRVHFDTPTELKAGGAPAARPEFGILTARIRDRISTLRALYDDGPLRLDFREFGDRAARVRMTRCDIRSVEISRRSARTGQVHSIGGFVGETEYEGDLAEFVPYLHAGQWTGVGRQTAWGKGAFRVEAVV